jgi:23S rRNA (adenine2030-N6)-methyltransferase
MPGRYGGEPRLYPGSPRILAQLLRPQDFLILNEKHPEDVHALRGVMRGTSAAVHERDAYEFWLAMVPPRTPRGVVVVDPPYEQTDERARITATLAAAHRKWAHGVTVIWYPLKDRATHGRVEGAAAQARHPEIAVEWSIGCMIRSARHL